ncbi:hypothetical protein FQN53_007212 [Emmonsiellopsis sp. PD_33]|nr:hypothetical protein FQN53_007212 [Emmonsiellopsis sp. PD_33]
MVAAVRPRRNAETVASSNVMKIPPKENTGRSISIDLLIEEVRGIYAGLVMVEKKCIEIDQQVSRAEESLSAEQWRALIALHRGLLHEHHDFFLASQHPSASPALRRLATKYAMPARMWRHGIHSFLGLLRHQLPGSLDHMLAFIYTAYSVMALLMESVPSFEDTWIECLSDLAGYRMSIEEYDPRDHEIWDDVARYWYNKASSENDSKIGRIQHHLALLARPSFPQPLLLYAKSLPCTQTLPRWRDDIVAVFDPTSGGYQPTRESADSSRTSSINGFIAAHGVLFRSIPTEPLPDDYCLPGLSREQAANFSLPSLYADVQDGEIKDNPSKLSQYFRRLLSIMSSASSSITSVFNIGDRNIFSHAHVFHAFFGWSASKLTARRERQENYISYNEYLIGVKAQRSLFCARLLSFTTMSILSSGSAALPIDESENKSASSFPGKVDDVVLLLFAFMSVPACFFAGKNLGQPRTFGTAMVVFNLVGLVTNGDPLNSAVGHWTGLGLSFVFTAIFAGLLARRFNHITRSLGHTISFLTVVGVVNYLLNRGSFAGPTGGEQTDSAVQYLLPSVAFTLICWWKVAAWSSPPSDEGEEASEDHISMNAHCYPRY